MSLRDLFVKVGFRDDATPGLKEINKNIDSLKDKFGKLGRNVGKVSTQTSKKIAQMGKSTKDTAGDFSNLGSVVSNSSSNITSALERIDKKHKLWELTANKTALALRRNSKESQILKEKSEILSGEIKRLSPVLEETKRKYGDNSKEASKLKDHLLDLKIQYAELNKELKSSTGINAIANSLDSIGDKLGVVGSELTRKVSIPLGGVGAAAVKTIATFDDTMAQVRSISGATQTEFDKLRKKALQMGRDTRFSASEAAEAFTYMSMAGWDAQQSLEGIDGVMMLAAASGEDLGLVSDIVTDALTAFGMKAKEASNFADLLASASSSSNTNVAMLGESFKYVAPLFGSLGYSAEDAALALGLMANAGIKGSQAGTSLKTAIANLANPTDKMAAAMKDLGLSITDADGKMKPFKTIMDELRDKFGKLTEEQKAQYASTIFGKEAMSGMLAIINASDEDYAKLTQATREYTGEAVRMAEINEDTIGGAFRSLASELEGAAIIVGDVLKPKVREVAEFIKKLTHKFSELSPTTQEAIVKIGTLAVAIGPALKVGKGLLKGVSKVIEIGGKLVEYTDVIKAALSGLGTFLKPLFGAIFTPWGLAITGAIIGGILLYKNWDTIKEKANELKEKVSEKLGALGESIKGKWESIKQSTSEKWESIKSTVGNKITGMKTSMSGKWQEMKQGAVTAWTGIKIAIGTRVEAIKANVGAKWAAIKTNTAKTWANMKASVAQHGGGIRGLVKATGSFITRRWSSAASKMDSITGGKFSSIARKVGSAFSRIKRSIDGGINKIKEWNKTKLRPKTVFIKRKIETMWDKIKGRAVGTNFHPGGQVLVGEKGPELVSLPRGARIATNAETRRIVQKKETTQNNQRYATSEVFAPQINISIEGNTDVKEQIPDIKREVEKALYPLLEEYWAQMRIKRPSMT